MVTAHARRYGDDQQRRAHRRSRRCPTRAEGAAAKMRYFSGSRDHDPGVRGSDRRTGGETVSAPGKRTEVELRYGSPVEPAPVIQAKATGAGPAARAPLALDGAGGAALPEQLRRS